MEQKNINNIVKVGEIELHSSQGITEIKKVLFEILDHEIIRKYLGLTNKTKDINYTG